MKELNEVLPHDLTVFESDKAYKLLNKKVVKELDGCVFRWPGPQKYVFTWWILEDGRCIGLNENPARGYSLPVESKNKLKSKYPNWSN